MSTLTAYEQAELRLLDEIEQLIRTRPQKVATASPADLEWLGSAQAAVDRWDVTKGTLFRLTLSQLQSSGMVSESLAPGNWANLLTMLYEARAHLRSKYAEPPAEVFAAGRRYEYFDHLRKIIEAARAELFFVDPYIDAEFISRYLPQVPVGVSVRLLASKGVASALPAVLLIEQQRGLSISLRARPHPELHDRYVFVDGRECYSSGASFKDGAKNSNTAILPITDAFDALKQAYEKIWTSAAVVH